MGINSHFMRCESFIEDQRPAGALGNAINACGVEINVRKPIGICDQDQQFEVEKPWLLQVGTSFLKQPAINSHLMGDRDIPAGENYVSGFVFKHGSARECHGAPSDRKPGAITRHSFQFYSGVFKTRSTKVELREDQAHASNWRMSNIRYREFDGNQGARTGAVDNPVERKRADDFDIAGQPRTQCDQGGIGTFLRRIGGATSDFQRMCGIGGLSLSEMPQPSSVNPQQDGRDREYQREGDNWIVSQLLPPHFSPRLVATWLAVIGAALCGAGLWWRERNFGRTGEWWGFACFVCGATCFGLLWAGKADWWL